MQYFPSLYIYTVHLATNSAFYRDYTALTEWCARLSGQYGPSNGQYGHDDGQYGPDNRILHSNSLPLEYAHVVTPLSTGGNISQTCDKYIYHPFELYSPGYGSICPPDTTTYIELIYRPSTKLERYWSSAISGLHLTRYGAISGLKITAKIAEILYQAALVLVG